MRRRPPEPSGVDRLLHAALVVAVVGALVGGGYVVLHLDDVVVPVRPNARPAGVAAAADWYGPRGAKEGIWIDCRPLRPAGVYDCRTWWASGAAEVSMRYRYVGDGVPPGRPVVETWAPPSVTLDGGGRLERVPAGGGR